MERFIAMIATSAALALGSIGLIVPSGQSAAQAPKGPSQSIAADRLFNGPDSTDMPGGAGRGTSWLVDFVTKAQQAQAGSKCPIDVDVTVFAGVHPGIVKTTTKADLDRLRVENQALAFARRDVIASILKGFGPSVRVTSEVSEQGLARMVAISAHSAQDKEKPKLTTTSKPTKGSKVQPGQQIVVTMKARDDANAWQSGIKTVTLVADSEGDRLIAGPTYPPAPAGCVGTPPEREVRATYTVPANPPPVVRLTATAMDHVGLTDFDVGEFPTGDFYGTFTQVSFTVGRDVYRTQADIVFNHDGKGNLTGTMTGRQVHVDYSTGGCSFRMVQPGRFRVSLVGAFTETSSPKEGSTLKVFIRDIEETVLRAEALCDGGRGGPIGPPGGWTFKMGVWTPEQLLGSPSPLGEGEVLPDGTRQYKWTHETGGAGTRGTVTLRRAAN
ncbi:MAG: hypothetical protein K2Y71_26355 [Xanthobacteraceae bacterium]|nr:hypothetical protein [Xanthobacteraceae bacterium]